MARRFAPTLRRPQRKDLLPAPALNQFIPPYPVPPGQAGKPYRDGWDITRAVESGMQASTWVYRCVEAISGNIAKLPVEFRKGSMFDGEEVKDHPLLDLFNFRGSPYEASFIFRKRLSQQVLLNRQGAMIEVIKDRMGRPIALYLLPAGYTWPIPNELTFVSAFRVQMPGKAWFDIPAENVVWIRNPHPTDPYSGLTPLEAAGLMVEVDWYAKLYNRNFLLNDGRPGGILVVKGDIDQDDARELKQRFMGPTAWGPGGAGRVTVLESDDGADWVDTATSPRDAQHVQSRETAKLEILEAFGVPESVIGNASGRTFDNADAELEVFWRETMLPHGELTARCLDILDPDPKLFFGFDLSQVHVLNRDKQARDAFALTELAAGAIMIDEYREITGRKPLLGGAGRIYISNLLTPISTEHDAPLTDDEQTAAAAKLAQQQAMAQALSQGQANQGSGDEGTGGDVDAGMSSNGGGSSAAGAGGGGGAPSGGTGEPASSGGSGPGASASVGQSSARRGQVKVPTIPGTKLYAARTTGMAGLVVKAEDTGRVLMQQRAFDPKDPAGGMWECPGGHVEPGEDAISAAKREWAEETGCHLPDGDIGGMWTADNGYQGYVWLIDHEADVPINSDDREVRNPDDPHGDLTETAAWQDPLHLPGWVGLRPEAQANPWQEIALAGNQVLASS